MGVSYATRRDLYRFGGIARGLLENRARLVSSALASTDIVTLGGHTFETDDPILFRISPATGAALPAPLVADTTYYAIRVDDARFKVATAAGGAAINLTSDGVSVAVAGEPPIDKTLELYSRWVDDQLPAHAVPLTPDSTQDPPYPLVVVKVVCQCAGKALLNLDGKNSELVASAEAAGVKQLERYAAGLTLRDAKVTTHTLKAISEAAAPSSGDPRGWGSGSLP